MARADLLPFDEKYYELAAERLVGILRAISCPYRLSTTREEA